MKYLQPRVPGREWPITVSHSEAETAARCPFQHQLAYRERWSKAFSADSAAGQGIAWHEVLEAHYETIATHQRERQLEGHAWWDLDQEFVLYRAQLAARARIEQRRAEGCSELADLLDWMYDGYCEQWGIDPQWRIVAVERAGTVPLNPESAQWLPALTGPQAGRGTAVGQFLFKYRVDLIVEEDGKLWGVDHKSVHNFPSQMDLDFDSQLDRYTWALWQEGLEVYGQRFNQARRRILKRDQPLEERFRRPYSSRTRAELDVIANDLFRTAYWRWAQQLEMEDQALAAVEIAEDRGLQLPLRPPDAPRATSSRHCGRVCDFTEACLAGRRGADTRRFLTDLGMVQDFTRH